MVQNFKFEALDRLPPQNIEAEEAILGGILLDPEALGRVTELLQPDAFYISAHRTLYKAALSLQAQGQPTDLMTLTAWLKDHDQLEKIGGQTRLAQLVDRTLSAANIDQYASLVMDKYTRRKLIQTGGEISQLGYETGSPLAEVLDQSEQKLFGITQDRPQAGLTATADILTETFSDIEQRSLGMVLPGVACGFYDLDAMTQGFQRSDLIIAAGRPAMGKCLSHDSEIVLADGSIQTIAELYRQQRATLLTLRPDWQLALTQPSAYVDDGFKPVYQVKTRLGRRIETTLSHPFLTSQGWQPLAHLTVGQKVAVPRRIPVFGRDILPESQVKILGYLIGDGCLTGTSPIFTNRNPQLQADFTNAALTFPGVKVYRQDAGGMRTPSVVVGADPVLNQQHRQAFAGAFKTALKASGWSARQLARQLEVSPSLVGQWQKGTCAPDPNRFEHLCQLLQVDPRQLAPAEVESIRWMSQNSMTLWLKQHGLWGKSAHDKSIPDCVFRLVRSQLATFLNRVFATDGWATVLATGQGQLGFVSESEKLMGQVQHLLLRFGIIGRLKSGSFPDQGQRCPAYQLEITDAASIRTFAQEIGIFSKEAALAKVLSTLDQRATHPNCDLIPGDIWPALQTAKAPESWQSLGYEAGGTRVSNLPVNVRSRPRTRLAACATVLGEPDLQPLANRDVYWDEIVAIEFEGEKQVYDLTIPDTHNFIANDICVHNTSFVLNIARNIAVMEKLPVAIFSLEMSKAQLVYRLLSSEVQIESGRLRAGRIAQHEWEALGYGISALSQLPVFIDDTPNISVTEMRSKARRLQAEQGGALGLILIDYLQLMEGGGDNRVQELSKITRALKGLGRELNVPIIALSQLSRGVESRTNKRPMMSDLRESGSIEQDADLIMMLYREEYYDPDTPDRGIAEIIVAKHRNGPTGTIKLLFEPEFTRFRNLAGG